MPPTKKILKTTFFEPAIGSRKCSWNKKHKIPKGEKCLVVKDGFIKKNYCMKCGESIIKTAREQIDLLINGLDAKNQ